ncbi:MAG: Periplasmic pH-dependent serine endoprotease DegQ [Paracidovorax wautersii]|uniref:Periplasmic pH-dependent serine endoprotease DegQ n=1 Tax=Paracidovorax wautersii TaxID=1177982 RepID=A0A7V8FPM5_9BURK|nr:MAG: Periplasmic pH-dependent serine endoprotease DegQ [Paracidovorax wautersii]
MAPPGAVRAAPPIRTHTSAAAGMARPRWPVPGAAALGAQSGLAAGPCAAGAPQEFRDPSMKRLWLLFAQSVTVLLAALFIVATLKPQWLQRGASINTQGVVPVVEAPQEHYERGAPDSFRDAARKAAPAVVSINSSKAQAQVPEQLAPWYEFFGAPSNQPQASLGSGVIVSPDGYILTNNHVVEGADQIEVMLNDRRTAQVHVVGTDPDTDLAVLKIDLDNLPVITMAQSDSAVIGDRVLAIGNPFGVGQTVTSGIVSALGRDQLGINTFENFIQTDAAINPGNSGGALVDTYGNLLGINTAIYSRSGGSMGIGFAIPVSTARMVLDGIVRDGKVTRGWIGVETQALNRELAETLGLRQDSGVIVTGVLQNGPGARAGLQPGDVITALQDQPITSVAELLTRVAALKPGQPVTLQTQRQNQAIVLEVTPGVRPQRTLR